MDRRILDLEKGMGVVFRRRVESTEMTIDTERRRCRVVDQLLDIDLKGKKLLDVGCGLGVCMKRMKERGAVVTGLDISSKGKELFGLDIIEFDLNSGPLLFGDKMFDIAICTEVLEHTFYPHFVLKEIRRVLKDKGKAVISMPNSYNLLDRLRFLLGMKLYSHDIDSFGHHYLLNLDSIIRFIQQEFIIEKQAHEWLTGRKGKVLSFLRPIKPELVAINVILLCGKRHMHTYNAESIR